MATYYSQQLLAGATNKFAIASNSVSAFLLYPSISGNNNRVEIAFETSDLGSPVVSGSSAINITTSWGDIVRTLVYHNTSATATYYITSLSNRQSNRVVLSFSASRTVTAATVTNIGVGGIISREDVRKRNLGYI